MPNLNPPRSTFILIATLLKQARGANEFQCHFQNCKNYQNRTTRSEIMRIFANLREMDPFPVRELISIPVRELISFPVRELNPFPVREMTQNLHNFTSSSPILKIFAFLKMALKFVGTYSLLEECGHQN